MLSTDLPFSLISVIMDLLASEEMNTGKSPYGGSVFREEAALRGAAAERQVSRGGRSPEAAEENGCSWRAGNRFISRILL